MPQAKLISCFGLRPPTINYPNLKKNFHKANFIYYKKVKCIKSCEIVSTCISMHPGDAGDNVVLYHIVICINPCHDASQLLQLVKTV